eukprot:scaffold754_cov248-Pinguiococcus_pyrenoidosus.AAC.23
MWFDKAISRKDRGFKWNVPPFHIQNESDLPLFFSFRFSRHFLDSADYSKRLRSRRTPFRAPFDAPFRRILVHAELLADCGPLGLHHHAVQSVPVGATWRGLASSSRTSERASEPSRTQRGAVGSSRSRRSGQEGGQAPQERGSAHKGACAEGGQRPLQPDAVRTSAADVRHLRQTLRVAEEVGGRVGRRAVLLGEVPETSQEGR